MLTIRPATSADAQVAYDIRREAVRHHCIGAYPAEQMLAWTAALVVVFLADVYDDLVMPSFGPELLYLLGLSSGTYVAHGVSDNFRGRGDPSSPPGAPTAPAAPPHRRASSTAPAPSRGRCASGRLACRSRACSARHSRRRSHCRRDP